MRGVSRSVRRSAAVLVLITMFVAQVAAAAERKGDRSFRERFERAKRYVVVIFSRFGLPPG
jgi:hypothetical protein